MKESIELAIKGGYKSGFGTDVQTYSGEVIGADIHKILLDPLFWQALGKGLGKDRVCEDCGEGYLKSRDNCLCGMSYPPLTTWSEYAQHFFIDHLIEGRDIDSFFNHLINK